MKKIFAFVLILMFISSIYTSVIAADDTLEISSFSISEYDMVMDVVNKSDSELIAEGFSEEAIDEIHNMDIENAYKERASLPYEDLINMGYNDEQIDVLKMYDAGIIEIDDPLMAKASATVIGSITVPTASISTIKFRTTWYWTSRPVFTSNDSFAIGWVGTDNNGSPLNVAYNTGKARVGYHNETLPTVYNEYSGSFLSVYSHVQFDFPMAIGLYDGQWAETGWFEVELVRTGTANINEVGLCVAYVHNWLTFSPTINFDTSGASVSISVGSGQDMPFYCTLRIKSDGTIIYS